MLLLARTERGYPDSDDPSVTYVLPTGVEPATRPDGLASVSIGRSEDGGVLQLSLAPVWPVLDSTMRQAPFSSGRYRLVMRAAGPSNAGAWRAAATTGSRLVERAVSLTPIEAAIARRLGERGGDVVDVEIELEIPGRAPSAPWMVSVASATLVPRLAALLREQPASREAVEAAFLGLSEDTFTWYPLERGALRPARDAALRSVAHHLMGNLFTAEDGRWTLRQDPPARLDVSLAVSRSGTDTVAFRWSLSEFLARQPDVRPFLVDLAGTGPFAAPVLTVVNDVPLDEQGISRIALDVRTDGPSGTLHHAFVPGTPGSARLAYVASTLGSAAVQWRAHCTVQTASGAAVHSTPFAEADRSIQITPDAIGLCPLRVEALRDVFNAVEAVEVTIGSRTLTLTAARPLAWAVGRHPPATATLAVVGEQGQRHALGQVPMGPRGLTVDPALLGVGETVSIAIQPPADLASRVAYLAVQVEGGPWRTVDAATRLVRHVPGDGRWRTPLTRYRTRQVQRSSGGTTPMVDTAWRTVEGHTITIDLQP